MKVALYARVSTALQSTDLQTRDLRAYCRIKGWELVAEYVDEDQSGAKESRPELDRLMADARRRHFQAVIVWRFDRFGRSTSHLLKVVEEFQSLGIEFISHQEQIDTTTPQGKLFFTMVAAFAEFERAILRDRIRAGIRAARARGKRLGRPAKPVDVEMAYSFHRAGKSWNWIARRLHVSPRSLRRALPEKPGQNPLPFPPS